MLYDPRWEVEAPAKLLPWQEVIVGLIKVLEERGWCQKTFKTSDGRVCLAGALRAFHPCDDTAIEAWQKIEDATAAPGSGWPCAVSWNDGLGRTKEQVIDMLQSLIKS